MATCYLLQGDGFRFKLGDGSGFLMLGTCEPGPPGLGGGGIGGDGGLSLMADRLEEERKRRELTDEEELLLLLLARM